MESVSVAMVCWIYSAVEVSFLCRPVWVFLIAEHGLAEPLEDWLRFPLLFVQWLA
jgi:hypothetical protein